VAHAAGVVASELEQLNLPLTSRLVQPVSFRLIEVSYRHLPDGPGVASKFIEKSATSNRLSREELDHIWIDGIQEFVVRAIHGNRLRLR
jgi:hypothetical protein